MGHVERWINGSCVEILEVVLYVMSFMWSFIVLNYLHSGFQKHGASWRDYK